MHVLMISKACLVGAYQKKLVEIAAHDGVRLTVIVPPVWQDPAGAVELERMYTDGYDLLVDPIRFNGQFHLFYFPQLKQRLRRLQPDILHIDEEPYNLATWLAWRQGRRVGAKTLFFSWQNINRPYPFPFSWMEKQVLAGVDYGIMGNQAAAQVWRDKGYRGPHQVIPQFGVDLVQYAPPARRDRSRGLVIGAANRRLVPEKGMDLLLEAAARLSGEWRLHIVGDGPERPSLERLAQKLGIAERVKFDGVLGSARMPEFLRELDVLVLSSRSTPSWQEQFGRVLVEAMACEVAVVGADSGEIPHVIGDAGLIFPENDVTALHTQLQRLLQSESLRDELGRRGRVRAAALFSQAEIASRTVAVYRDMIPAAGVR